MPVVEKARELLDLSRIALSPVPAVLRIDVEDYMNMYGEDALRVTVLLDESVDVEQVGGKAISRLKSAIRSQLLDAGIGEFAYIWLVKPSELAEDDEES